jgi:serine/threonine protein kinase
LEFLTEIANAILVRSSIVDCYGISQDPETRNYVMVMEYMKDGNLRQYLQNKNSELGLEDKLGRLEGIVAGLSNIHQQNLIHRDFHSGNILNGGEHNLSIISDLGLSYPARVQKQEGKVFGVLPYVAPEVLQGQPYTPAADIYSFAITAYEFLANSFPYYDYYQKGLSNEELREKIYKGLRPNIDKVPIPQLLKDFIKRC